MMEDNYRHYLRDVGLLVRERAVEAKHQREDVRGTPSFSFEDGRAMAYYEVVSLLLGQADVFGLAAGDLRMEGLDPDRDLL
jgi:hypothetical protein